MPSLGVGKSEWHFFHRHLNPTVLSLLCEFEYVIKNIDMSWHKTLQHQQLWNILETKYLNAKMVSKLMLMKTVCCLKINTKSQRHTEGLNRRSEGQQEGVGENEAWGGDKGQSEEKEGWDTPSSQCIPARHIPVHIWLQYTRYPLPNRHHSLSHAHTRDLKLSIIAYVQAHMWTQKSENTLNQRFLLPPPYTNTHKQCVRLNTHYLLSFLSCQASLHKRGSGDRAGWLKVFRAVPLFWWLSTAVYSHVLPGKPDLNIYEWLTQMNRK